MDRRLRFSKFRNLGFDEPTSIILNRSLERNKIGDLIVVIGQNNAGKSNVIDAVEKIQLKRLDKRDQTTLVFSSSARPHLYFEVSDDSVKGTMEITDSGCQYHRTSINTSQAVYSESELQAALNEIITLASEMGVDVSPVQAIRAKGNLNDHLAEIRDALNQLKLKPFLKSGVRVTDPMTILETSLPQNLLLTLFTQRENADPSAALNQYFESKYGIPFTPTVVRYKETPIRTSDLNVTPSQLKSNTFFSSVFESIGVSADTIVSTYAAYNEFHNIAILDKLTSQLTKGIKKLNDEFNRLYFASRDPYLFSIHLDSGLISFGMARGKDGDAIMLDYQSTGFRWFFNFFFNFLFANRVRPGDIVLMDEPATNLHPQGQQELRRFIKDFAVRNGITFIVATHSPFLIDPDNYDELRVVSMENNRARIDNLFSAVNPSDPDSLIPIKESLTISQNVLYDYDTQVAWVEGITDYNYLTMFKRILGKKNIAFVPFQGVGLTDEEQKAIIGRLKNVKFFKRMILIDGDKAGLAFKTLCQETAFKDRCITIKDLSQEGKKFKEIEDLFSEDDRAKFASLNAESDSYKKANFTSVMKRTCKREDFSEETLANFDKLFDMLTY